MTTVTHTDKMGVQDKTTNFHGLSFLAGILVSITVIIVFYGCNVYYKKRKRNIPLERNQELSLYYYEDYLPF